MDKYQIIGIIIILIAIISIGGFLYISSNTTNSKIEFENNETLKSGDTVVFLLKDEYKNPIPDAAVDLKILDESGSATKASITTDASGHGSFTIPPLDNGNYTVHCNFNGTMFHKETRNQMSLNIDDGYSSDEYSY